jgi:glycosyltransferase involved in cell wall biosynthesis
MRILLYSYVFWPSVGGVETITATLADNIIRLGHDCVVVTETPLNGKEEIGNYEVVRKPGYKKRLTLARQSSIIHSNGSSVAMFPYARLAGRPFIWTHNGYQVSCVDGLGWLDGEAAPMSPVASLRYHYRKRGLTCLLKESVKLTVRRLIANHVDLNIACTQWVAQRQPLSNQVVAYTPYSLKNFASASREEPTVYDFIYVGRLVSEKGLPDLIKAFHLLVSDSQYQGVTLAIVGDGFMKTSLQEMTDELKLNRNVFFLGSKQGADLVKAIAQSRIGIVPSRWEEPMGGVSLELLAAGKNLIVSADGGHAECVGDAGLKFKNGDYNGLHKCMRELLTNTSLAIRHKENALLQVKAFDEIELTKKYIEIYKQVIRKKLVPEDHLEAKAINSHTKAHG